MLDLCKHPERTSFEVELQKELLEDFGFVMTQLASDDEDLKAMRDKFLRKVERLRRAIRATPIAARAAAKECLESTDRWLVAASSSVLWGMAESNADVDTALEAVASLRKPPVAVWKEVTLLGDDTFRSDRLHELAQSDKVHVRRFVEEVLKDATPTID